MLTAGAQSWQPAPCSTLWCEPKLGTHVGHVCSSALQAHIPPGRTVQGAMGVLTLAGAAGPWPTKPRQSPATPYPTLNTHPPTSPQAGRPVCRHQLLDEAQWEAAAGAACLPPLLWPRCPSRSTASPGAVPGSSTVLSSNRWCC